MKKTIRLLIMAAALFGVIHGQPPPIGAQMWIERGQFAAEIDGWFKLPAELNMPMTRLPGFQSVRSGLRGGAQIRRWGGADSCAHFSRSARRRKCHLLAAQLAVAR